MKCPNCNETLENKPNFCPYCGENISEEIKKVKTQKRNKNIKWLLLTLVPVAIILTAFAFFNNQNGEYDAAINKGMEAVSSEEYEKATVYFEKALDVKNGDEKTGILYQNTVLLEEAKTFYINQEFDQTLEKVNQVLDAESNVKELDVFIEKAEELKIKTESILDDRAKFKKEFEKAKNIFDRSDLDEKGADDVLAILNQILTHAAIDENYHDETKQATETFLLDVKTYVVELAELKAVAQEQERLEAIEKEDELSEYSAKEIEYARIILMTGYPGSPTVYVYNDPAGKAVASGYEETIKFPDETVTLTGEIGADGMFVYSPIGGGYIKVYPAPSHWHQDDQSPEGYRKYAQQILDSAEEVYIDPGDPNVLLEKLRITKFIMQDGS